MRSFFALFLLLLSAAAQAQDKDFHTIYYKNGQKAMEGHWGYAYESYFSNSITLSVIMSREGPDAEPNVKRRQEWGLNRQAPTLSILPEGLIKTWYSTGRPKIEITFSTGAASGPYKSYYREGTLAEEGILKRGQPDGEWKIYNRDGTLYFTGAYKVRPRDEMDAEWKKLFRQYDRTIDSAESKTGAGIPGRMYNGGAGINTEDQSYKWSAAELLRSFARLDVATEKVSVRSGTFLFPYPDGSILARLIYRNDVRSGTWEFYNRPGHRAVSVEFDSGKIAGSTDSFGKRRSLTQLKEQWKEEELKRANWPQVTAPAGAQVFRMVEQMPAFNGPLDTYLSSHLRYPAGDNTEGKVVVEFIVQADGSIAGAKVVRPLAPAFDAEALRVVRAMPRWIPGRNNWVAVACYFTLPVTFRRE